MTKKQGIFKKF